MSHPATWPPHFGLLVPGGLRWDKTSPCMTTLLLTPQMAVHMGGGGKSGRKLAEETLKGLCFISGQQHSLSGWKLKCTESKNNLN